MAVCAVLEDDGKCCNLYSTHNVYSRMGKKVSEEEMVEIVVISLRTAAYHTLNTV